MTEFVIAVVLLIATPGPGVLAVAGIGTGFGWRAGLRFVLGVFIGTNTVAVIAASGLAALVLSLPGLRVIMALFSFSYLVFLASSIVLRGYAMKPTDHSRAPGVRDGIILQMVNPKNYAVNIALFTGFPILAGEVAWEIGTKFAIITLVWVPVHLCWLLFGASLSRLALAPRTRQLINLLMAVSMVAAAGLAALSFVFE